MLRSLLVAAVLLTPSTSLAGALQVGETLACTSPRSGDHITIVVGRLDTMGGETVVGISLLNASTDRPPSGAAHLPIELGVLQSTCTRDADEALPLSPDFEEGYRLWRQAVDAGHAGYFTIPVDQIDEMLRAQMAKVKQGEQS